VEICEMTPKKPAATVTGLAEAADPAALAAQAEMFRQVATAYPHIAPSLLEDPPLSTSGDGYGPPTAREHPWLRRCQLAAAGRDE